MASADAATPKQHLLALVVALEAASAVVVASVVGLRDSTVAEAEAASAAGLVVAEEASEEATVLAAATETASGHQAELHPAQEATEGTVTAALAVGLSPEVDDRLMTDPAVVTVMAVVVPAATWNPLDAETVGFAIGIVIVTVTVIGTATGTGTEVVVITTGRVMMITGNEDMKGEATRIPENYDGTKQVLYLVGIVSSFRHAFGSFCRQR